MSSKRSAAALEIRPEPSVWLALGLTLMHALAALAVQHTALPWGLRLTILALVVASLFQSVCRHALRCARSSIRRLRMEADGTWRLEASGGAVVHAVTLGDSVVLTWLVILRLRGDDGSRQAVILTPDAVPAEVLRHLRVRLRAEAGPTPKRAREILRMGWAILVEWRAARARRTGDATSDAFPDQDRPEPLPGRGDAGRPDALRVERREEAGGGRDSN